MKANSDKSKQSKKATRRVLAGVLCGASVLSLVLSLVMPPISQAIANDAQAGAAEETVMGDSSSEPTDVDNTANGDTENQNSDAIEGGEADPANGAEQGQPEGKLQAEDGELSDGNAVMLAAEGGQTKTAPTEIQTAIQTAGELQSLANANGAASFKLMNDIDTSETITLNKEGSNITLDLNGHKIKHTSQGQSLFNITGGATLTIKDTEEVSEEVDDGLQLNGQGQDYTPANYGREAELSYDNDGIPSYLSYYVTESSPGVTGTTESLVRHGIAFKDIKDKDIKGIKGAIVACGGTENLKLININGGHFSLESGVLTQQKDYHVGSLVHAENKSTVNMNGGYVCGGYCRYNGAGAGISVDQSTLNISNGVIAGNHAPSGGGVYAKKSAVTVAGGVISGNSTLNGTKGYGGGIMAEEGGSVTVSGGYITNNRYANFCGGDGNGCCGGAGLAAKNGVHVTISDGKITGNYSEEAGGGVYVTNIFQHDRAWLDIKGGIIASNVSYRSEGAGIRVGQMIDAMISGASEDSPVYITNNHCMSRFDWGGGGIFVQGDSNVAASNAGRLFVYNSYISANTAGGYGGGVAVCPTGKTLVTNTEGTAIFGNSSAGAEYDDGDRFKNDYKYAYNSENNTGNEAKPHLSGGGSGKNQDKDAYNSKVFRENGHADFFLAAAAGHQEPLAAVIGKMLGDGDAKYSGSKERSDNKDLSDNEELYEAIKIPANGGVKIYRSVGLTSAVKVGSDEANNAQKAARTFITGNYSWDHGGGIMSNGDLYLGQPADTYVYPSLKLKATKNLAGRELKAGDFNFTVYRKDSSDPIARGVFTPDACTEVGTASNDASGIIKFDLGEQFTANGTTGTITYYLVENAGTDSDITYDPAVYEITVELEEGKKDVLMSVPIRDNATATKELAVHNYTIKKLSWTKHSGDSTNSLSDLQKDEQGYYSIVDSSGATFTNTYTSYTSSGSWTPKATKVVEGGEMKEFTLEFATNKEFTENVQDKLTKADAGKSQTLSFSTIGYTLGSLKQSDSDVPGRGASKTFTYYVREQQPSMPFTNYKYDESVYEFKVVATDDRSGKITTNVTYTKIVNADGKDIPENEQKAVTYVPAKDEATGKEQSVPVFTNTYSTSLPLSGMSGVTLTYLAGAAVLCAAAAWMHIRRKANAKGGERRE
ncbi:Spy0128 family protein [Collinsella aerofaciens]|uniref:Spy0128 family protein n=1 Tax=Collinsella aerofaciens TaxID=74426 RepID=UPI0034A1A015